MTTVTQPAAAVTIDFADPAAVAAYVARINAEHDRQFGTDPTDHAPAFHPTPEEDAWQAATSPLNRLDDEAAAMDAIYTDLDDDHYPLTPHADPQSWAEYDALVNDNGQFGHTRETA